MISVLIGTDVGLASMTSTTGGGGAGACFFPQEAKKNAITGQITMEIVARIEPLKVSVFLGILADLRGIRKKGENRWRTLHFQASVSKQPAPVSNRFGLVPGNALGESTGIRLAYRGMTLLASSVRAVHETHCHHFHN
jgi:hypothetical protein